MTVNIITNPWELSTEENKEIRVRSEVCSRGLSLYSYIHWNISEKQWSKIFRNVTRKCSFQDLVLIFIFVILHFFFQGRFLKLYKFRPQKPMPTSGHIPHFECLEQIYQSRGIKWKTLTCFDKTPSLCVCVYVCVFVTKPSHSKKGENSGVSKTMFYRSRMSQKLLIL